MARKQALIRSCHKADDLNYDLWYVPQFPLERLYKTPLETTWTTKDRARLAADIEKRGLLQPLIVWNHTSVSRRPGPRPWYLKIGYNKLWACQSELKWTHMPAIVAINAGASLDLPGELVHTVAQLYEHWLEGHFYWVRVGPVSKPVVRLEHYFGEGDAEKD